MNNFNYINDDNKSKVKFEEINKENNLYEASCNKLNMENSMHNKEKANLIYPPISLVSNKNIQTVVDKEYMPYSTLYDLYNYDNRIYYTTNKMNDDNLSSDLGDLLNIKKNKLNKASLTRKSKEHISNDKNIKKHESNMKIKGKLGSLSKIKTKKEIIKSYKMNNIIRVSLTKINSRVNSASQKFKNDINYSTSNNYINNNHNHHKNLNSNNRNVTNHFINEKDKKVSTLKSNNKTNSSLNFISMPHINSDNINIISSKENLLSSKNLLLNFSNYTPFSLSVFNNGITTIDIPVSEDTL